MSTSQPSIEQLIAARNDAMEKVRAWWDAERLAGRLRDQTEAPAWPEYLAAFAALDEVRSGPKTNPEICQREVRDIMILKFSRTDNGNCRVYYRDGRSVRCFQEDRPGEFTYYVCSKDGEPDSEAKPLPIDRLPDDDSSTARAFRKWWEARS